MTMINDLIDRAKSKIDVKVHQKFDKDSLVELIAHCDNTPQQDISPLAYDDRNKLLNYIQSCDAYNRGFSIKVSENQDAIKSVLNELGSKLSRNKRKTAS